MLRLKHARQGSTTLVAATFDIQIPVTQLIPVTPDKSLPAVVAVSALTRLVMHIAGIGVAHAVIYRDFSARVRVVGGVGGTSSIFQSG